MTRLLVVLDDAGDGEAALRGGATLLGLRGEDVAVLQGLAALAAGGVVALPGRLGADGLAQLGAAGVAWIGVEAAQVAGLDGAGSGGAGLLALLPATPPPDLALLPGLAASGAGAVMLLLDAQGSSGLDGHGSPRLDAQGSPRPRLDVGAAARFVGAARAAGLSPWIGGIEPPDVPRLMVLRPDVLGAGAALRGSGDARRAPVRAEAVAGLQALLRGRTWAPEAATDLVFVRDLVLPIEVGAYAHERGQGQRVRFEVQAWVTRPDGPARGMRDVFSYDVITDAIRLLTQGRHVALLETLAEEIAGRVLAHAVVARVAVRLEKLDTGNGIVGCAVERER